jgi:hypothetical protein
MFANVLLGGLLALAAPILALALRGKMEGEYKKRALELAPDTLRAAAAKVGPKIDEMVDDFAAKLDAWVVTAGEELHREVLEVLKSAQEARASGTQDEAQAKIAIEAQATQLTASEKKLEEMRADLWAPPGGRIRIAAEEAVAAAAVPVVETKTATQPE